MACNRSSASSRRCWRPLGPSLNWGTFTSAGWNLGEVELATAPDPYFFDKDHPNGSPILYTYNWDAAAEVMVVAEEG